MEPPKRKNTIDQEWDDFMKSTSYTSQYQNFYTEEEKEIPLPLSRPSTMEEPRTYTGLCPKATDIYISTKTKIAFLNTTIDLKEIFWKIPVIEYGQPIHGVIKKQMKFNSLHQEELMDIEERTKDLGCCEQYIITSINNPMGRIKFKDIRKISIGISKKDIMSYRCKKKSAFYNCFVMIVRLNCQDMFREFHVKVFNTGKIEIPGIQTEENFHQLLDYLIEILTPLVNMPIEVMRHMKTNAFRTETVLMNSNFNCGFYINRESFYEILKMKYNIQSIYDPCSYPGIQCKIYYHEECGILKSKETLTETITSTSIVEVTFMVFRTGSILIVGKCDEDVLHIVYDYIKTLLIDEYMKIHNQEDNNNNNNNIEFNNNKSKKNKIRKKTIQVLSSSLSIDLLDDMVL